MAIAINKDYDWEESMVHYGSLQWNRRIVSLSLCRCFCLPVSLCVYVYLVLLKAIGVSDD